jgi:ketosteroid isomerase-like protein
VQRVRAHTRSARWYKGGFWLQTDGADMNIAPTLRIGLLAALSACSVVERAPSGPADWRPEVLAAERAFARTMADRDLKAFSTFVADEAVFFAGDQPLRGRQAIVAAWARYFEGPQPPFSWEPELVEVLDSGLLALSSGPVRNPAGQVVARFNSIWRLEPDGRWRVVFDKGSPAK